MRPLLSVQAVCLCLLRASSVLMYYATCFTYVPCMYFYDPFGSYRLLMPLLLPRRQMFLSQTSTCGTCVRKSSTEPGNSPSAAVFLPCHLSTILFIHLFNTGA